ADDRARRREQQRLTPPELNAQRVQEAAKLVVIEPSKRLRGDRRSHQKRPITPLSPEKGPRLGCLGPTATVNRRLSKEQSLCELLDALIAGIGNVEAALAIDGNATGRAERARLGRWPRRVGADDGAPNCQWLARRRQLLNPTVACVADVDVSARINSDARR